MLATLAVLAGCGGDDRLSGEEFSAELQEADRNVSAAFERVFETIGDAREGETVAEPTREAAIQAAETEREAADALDELTPPEDAEEATDELVEQARAQADAIEEAASRGDVTVAELADAFQEASPEAALSELRDLGYLAGEDEQGGGGATADVDRYCELSQQLDEAGSQAFRELEQDPSATREDFEQAEADFVREHEAELEEITQVAPPEIQNEVQVLISSIRGRAGLEEQAPDEQAERQADQTIRRFERQNCPDAPGGN